MAVITQVVLTFQLEKEKDETVKEICKKLNIRKVDVGPADYVQTIGYLAGVTGFCREKAVYQGSGFAEEMLVFSGMNPGQVDTFLAEYKRSGQPAVGLKAVATMYNVSWTADTLYTQLKKEREGIG